jgi:SAM-dependent methyltransferase
MTDPLDYLAVNRANWDARAPIHAENYGIDRLLGDPSGLSQVVEFDRPRLGGLAGLEAVHLQCHIGTDTLSLHRLGARMTGVDLSPASLAQARKLAGLAGADIDFVESDVYSAPVALGGRQFDLVYTGIGAIGWLPDIRWWPICCVRVAGCSSGRAIPCCGLRSSSSSARIRSTGSSNP